MFKKILVLVLALVVCMAGVVNAFAAEDKAIDIEMNGKTIGMAAKVWEGELFLPLRAISEELQYDVQWFGDKKEIKVSKPEKSISLSLSGNKIVVNNHEAYIPGGYRLINGRTYLRQDSFSDDLGLKVVWDKVNNKVILQEVKENSFTINTKKENSETQTLKLTLQYPELKGLDNAEVQNELNSLFARLAGEAKARGQEVEQYIGQDEITRHIKAEVYFDYQVKYNQSGLLSIVFMDYLYSGGAHGGTVQSSYTFDLKTGKEYEIKDLFKDGSDYISIISSEVKKQMQEREMTVLLAPFDSIKADQDYYLSNNTVVVYFQQYEYLPYAYGIPEFAVDFSLMKDMEVLYEQ
jgi:hypothetical protein